MMNIAHFTRSLLFPSYLHTYENQGYRSKKCPTVVFLHGIGNNAHTWDSIVDSLPDGSRYISVDLLGFGRSPKPEWELYDASSHARALARTLRRMEIKGPLIIVGHSLGAFVAIQYAKKHPKKVNRLILCSPPFYQPPPRKKAKIVPRDEVYRKLYQYIRKNSGKLLLPAKLYSQYMSLNKGRDINEKTVPAFVKSLEASIENQSSYKEIQKIRIPTDIIYGRFDILLIKKNLQSIKSKNKDYISLKSIAAGHDVMGLYGNYLSKYLKKILVTYQGQDHPK